MTNSLRTNKYLYLITAHRVYKELCAMEMRALFGNTTTADYHVTNVDLDISRSTFLKGRIDILYTGLSVEAIEAEMITDLLSFDDYKIHYLKFDSVPYEERLLAMRKLGYTIEGNFAIKNPNVNFALTKIDGIWIFGFYTVNTHEWLTRKRKPFNYSNAIEVRLAKTVLNIAIENNHALTIVDPCCGIGTIVIEALTMGLDIEGYEISPFVKINANKNLIHFGFTPIVKKMDMHEIGKQFDVSILDLPYGLYSATTKEEQVALIKKAKSISSKLVLISMEDMSDTINNLGYAIVDICQIEKSNAFSRYLIVCK